ncbi:MAG: SSU ribosomal protein S20p, partial [uncultured Friedmanniella sp.]
WRTSSPRSSGSRRTRRPASATRRPSPRSRR